MKKNIAILGGGFGGLRAALDLARKLKTARLLERYEIVLIDRHEYQTYTPLLYLAAVPPARPAKTVIEDRAALGFKKILKGTGVTFKQGESETLDLMNGDIHFADGDDLAADYLVIAPGSESNYFSIPGLQENSLALKSLEEAQKIRTALAELFARDGAARIVIGGGGPSGIELAGEIKYSYPRARVAIVDAAPTLLSGFSLRILKAAEARLRKLGVEIIIGEAIASVMPGQAACKSGRAIPFGLLLWTGGVKAPAFLSTLPVKTETRGHVEVGPVMLCLPQNLDLKLHSTVYALGDSVCVYDPRTGKPLPGVAPAAIEQGKVAAENIFQDIQMAEGLRKEMKRAIYAPKEHLYVLPIGGNWAVAKIGLFVFKGFLGALFKRAIEAGYSLSLR
jgi:NADH dehydrogenase